MQGLFKGYSWFAKVSNVSKLILCYKHFIFFDISVRIPSQRNQKSRYSSTRKRYESCGSFTQACHAYNGKFICWLLLLLLVSCIWPHMHDKHIFTGAAAETWGWVGWSHQKQREATEESAGADGVHPHAPCHPQLCTENYWGVEFSLTHQSLFLTLR